MSYRMDDLKLDSDENLLIRAQAVHVRSKSFEAVLTSKRIILKDIIENLLPQKEIPLATLKSVEPGENAIGDQIITLALLTKTGDSRQMVLTFSPESGGNRNKERDEWLRLIKDHLTPEKIIITEPAVTPAPDERKGQPIDQNIQSIKPLIKDSVPHTEAAPAIPESVQASPVPPLPPVPAAPRKKRTKILAALIIIIVIIAVAAVGFVVTKNLQKNTIVQPEATTQPLTTTTTPTTTLPTPTPVATAIITTKPVPQTTQVLIPPTGVWVEITYDKIYTGLVGAPGMQQDVNDTGDHFYEVPTTDGTVAVSIQKTDGSVDELTVIVYSDGKTVKTVSTTTPLGIIDLAFSLATPTPTATPVLTTLPIPSPTSNATTVVNTTNSTLSIKLESK